MITKILERRVDDLTKEIAQLKAIVFGCLEEKDPEGEYRPEFVRKILRISKKKEKGTLFKSGADLLKKIR